MSKALSVVPVLAVVGLAAGAAVAQEAIFADGFESGHSCVWSARHPAVDCTGAELTVTLAGGVPLALVYVPGGTFSMGSPAAERGRNDDEDLHQVTLTSDSWIGKYEVTQGQWEAVMGVPLPANDCGPFGAGAEYPVYCVSWNDIAGAGGFVTTLNGYLESTGQVTGFRLPTEAEWERAARAATQTRFSHGDVLGCGDGCEACPTHSLYLWWCGDQPNGSTSQPVGSKLPNGYGLYDLHGNEWEWVQDWYQQHLGTSPVTDPTGPASGSIRVIRGGGWDIFAKSSRSASRSNSTPSFRSGYLGLRLARTAG